MKHMELDDRNRLEFLAACGRSANQIAEDRGRSPSAIRAWDQCSRRRSRKTSRGNSQSNQTFGL